MKPTVYILLISSFLVACSKEVTDPNTYRVTVKENFTDPLKQLENIQVDDYVPYTITLTDNKEGGEYRLTSLKEGERYHQTIGKDFVLSLTNDPKTPINKEQKYLSFSSKGTHSFYIRPLEPGTFKLTFELQKYVGDKAVGDAIKVNVSFNAVKIRADFDWKFDLLSLGRRCFYYMVMNDGDGEGDNYLSNSTVTQTCSVIFDFDGEEQREKGSFNGRAFRLKKTREDGHKVIIKNIKIIQKSEYHPDFIIEYPNLNIKSDL